MPREFCKNCGLPPTEHCLYEKATAPDGCVCDAFEWLGGNWENSIPPICKAFAGAKRCNNCEHDKACHEEAK